MLAGPQPVFQMRQVIDNMARLLSRARYAGLPVFFMQHVDQRMLPGTEAWRFHPSLPPAQNEEVLVKPSYDAFYETPLLQRLQALSISHLVVAGCMTNFCIDTTCRRAVTLGFNVTLVRDAHTAASFLLPAAMIVAYHNAVLNGFGMFRADGSASATIEVKACADVQFDSATLW
ncbi:MAG: cysteine hydrolase family protein [Herpetosiphon sp.]